MANNISPTFRAGAIVEVSGHYRVFHARGHSTVLDVTCVAGEIFPECRECDAENEAAADAGDGQTIIIRIVRACPAFSQAGLYSPSRDSPSLASWPSGNDP